MLRDRIVKLSSCVDNGGEGNENVTHLLEKLVSLCPERVFPIVPFVSSFPIFSKEECEEIVRYSERNLEFCKQMNAKREVNTSQFDLLSAYLMPGVETNYVYNRMREMVVIANNALWNFELMDFAEPIKIHKYSVGNSTCAHTDIGSGATNFRKITAVVQLSDDCEYDGGELIIENSDVPCSCCRRQGSVILFPSYLLHKVEVITRGTRYSMVVFAHGRPFR